MAAEPPAAQRRHVCMVVHAHYPIGEPRVQREARAAITAGYDVTVIAMRSAGEEEYEIVDGASVRRLPLRHRRGAGFATVLWEYILFALLAARALFNVHREFAIDVVHVHAPPDFLVFAALPLRLRGTRIILDVHDLSPHMFGARFGTGLAQFAQRLLSLIERIACGVADAVITVHDPYRQELVRHGVPPRKITVVMNAADDTLIERVLSRRTARSPGLELAYHGTVNEWYGVDLLVRAVALLKDEMPELRAVVLGEGDALHSVQELARDLEVADRVVFSGRYLPIEDALARVALAHCGVVPNRSSLLNRFALSSKLFEYVALGIPVVVSQLETLSAHFDATEVTFFVPGEAASLAAAVRSVSTSCENATRKAHAAAVRAESYSWRVQKRRYLRLLEAVAK